MLIAFFDSCGFVYQHYVTTKTTINDEYYRVLEKQRSHISQKWPEFKQNWIMHDNTVQHHRVRLVDDYHASKGI